MLLKYNEDGDEIVDISRPQPFLVYRDIPDWQPSREPLSPLMMAILNTDPENIEEVTEEMYRRGGGTVMSVGEDVDDAPPQEPAPPPPRWVDSERGYQELPDPSDQVALGSKDYG